MTTMSQIGIDQTASLNASSLSFFYLAMRSAVLLNPVPSFSLPYITLVSPIKPSKSTLSLDATTLLPSASKIIGSGFFSASLILFEMIARSSARYKSYILPLSLKTSCKVPDTVLYSAFDSSRTNALHVSSTKN
jgi:hypothetical protein